MMSIGKQTACILCGNLRIFSRQWKEKVDGKGTVVTHTESVCADTKCQKKVDEKFSDMKEKRAAAEERRRNNIVARRAKKQSSMQGGDLHE